MRVEQVEGGDLSRFYAEVQRLTALPLDKGRHGLQGLAAATLNPSPPANFSDTLQ